MFRQIRGCTPAFVLSIIVLYCPNLFAIEHCGDQDFQGRYGVLASGAVTVPGFPITGPFAQSGQVVADGNGKATFETTASYNGFIFAESVKATYEVFPDCTIRFDVEQSAPIFQPKVFDGVIADNKREVEFVIVIPLGQTIHATLVKQSEGRCSAASLAGSYAVDMSGAIIDPLPLLPRDFVRLGKLVADGKGKFTAETSVNYNGFLIQSEAISGIYNVAAGCAVTLQYDHSNTTWQWKGALIDNGKGADLIVDKPGTAISGTLKKQ